MLKTAEILEGTRSKDLAFERALEANNATRLMIRWLDDQESDALWAETMTTIRLLASEHPILDTE